MKDEQKEMLDRGDFYEVGLNAGSFGSEEVEYLHQKGIQVFSNLGDKMCIRDRAQPVQRAVRKGYAPH